MVGSIDVCGFVVLEGRLNSRPNGWEPVFLCGSQWLEVQTRNRKVCKIMAQKIVNEPKRMLCCILVGVQGVSTRMREMRGKKG